MISHSLRSLRARLVFLATGVLLVLLLIAWFALADLFEQHVERRIQAELTNHLNQLIVSLREPSPGKYELKKPLSDPRFAKPFSGLYWQVSDKDGVVLKSRSLWDFDLDEGPNSRSTNGLQEYSIVGPEQSDLFSVLQNVVLNAGSGEKHFLLTVSLDHIEINRAVADFSYDLGIALLALAIILIIAVLIQVSIGLLPLRQIQQELTELQQGKRKSLTNFYPTEIMPIIDEINDFVHSREISAERGRARAGDLAHGFKTPLSILSAQARRLEKAGQQESTTIIRQQIATMNQHVERELARAKLQSIQPGTSARTNILVDIDKLVATFMHMPSEHQINWNIDIPSGLNIQMDSGDFREVCGNLLENARKWAKSNVNISARENGQNRIILEIEDDGPGVEQDKLKEILQRGKRLDETVQGTGLGLAIASDIMNAYNFRLEAFSGKSGGLGIRLLMIGTET